MTRHRNERGNWYQ